MKIKLILAASATDPLRKNDPFMPLSLPILAAAAPGHQYVFVDMLWEDDVRFDEQVDVVGISVRYTAEKKAYEIADEFRRRGITVVLGGPQISSVPLRAIAHADAVVVGEGEDLWPVVLRDIEQKRLRSFYVASPREFSAKGYTVHQVRGYPDLAHRPMPVRGLYRKRYVFDTVYAVRGCPINCDFCAVTDIFGAKCRTRPVDEVVAEIATFRNYYYLLDDTVFGRPATYDYYLSLYDAIQRLPKRRFWTGQANLDAAADERGREVIRRAARAGLIYAAIGMESINPKTLEKSGALKKTGAGAAGDAIARMKENIRFIQDQGIIISGWFVIGYDDDTIETYHRTLEFCREMHIIPAIFPVKALPGTRLHERLAKEGKLDDTKLLNYRNPSISDEDVYRALREVFAAGFAPGATLRRTAYYLRRFSDERIHRAIFALVLQTKLKQGIDVSNDEFYVEGSGERGR